jgi:hypothetical protein
MDEWMFTLPKCPSLNMSVHISKWISLNSNKNGFIVGEK